MTAASEPTRPELAWALRKYLWLVICVVVVSGVLATLLGGSGSTDYKADALVVATRTSLSQSQLPRLASAVFNSGAVASSVIAIEGLDTTPAQLIPGRVSMVPFSDTVLFQINATGSSARDAAQLANDAASAFATQMNNAGPFVGTFKVLVPAQRPTAPLSSPRSPAVLFVVGLIGGLAISVVGLVLLLALRRPVTSEVDVEQVVHLPVFGTLRIPRRGEVNPEQMYGVRRVIRSLQSSSNGARSLAVVPCDGDWNLSEAVSMILAGDRTMRYVPFEEFGSSETGPRANSPGEAANEAGESPADDSVDAKPDLPKTTPPKTNWSRTPKAPDEPDEPDEPRAPDASKAPDGLKSPCVTVVGGFATDTGDDVPEAVFDVDARVLMVQIGTPEASVRNAARHFAVGELSGVVCVDRRRH